MSAGDESEAKWKGLKKVMFLNQIKSLLVMVVVSGFYVVVVVTNLEINSQRCGDVPP